MANPPGGQHEERSSLHPLPAEPFTIAWGESRAVSWSSTVHFRGARYSVPHTYRDTHVWVRATSDEVIIVATNTKDEGGATEIARHPKLGSGQASINDAHYPPRRPDTIEREPRAATEHEEVFLNLGDGAKQWLIEAAGIGARRIRALMHEALELAGSYDTADVDQALGLAATNHRFDPGDLESILCRHRHQPRRATSTHSLQNSTVAWSALGATTTEGDTTNTTAVDGTMDSEDIT